MSTKTRFEEEAKGNSEMAYSLTVSEHKSKDGQGQAPSNM